jgi:hypothetical protein
LNIIAPPSGPQQPENQLAALPPHILQTLHAEGIFSLSDWRRLGRKRFAIFGITARLAAQLDAAAREVRP